MVSKAIGNRVSGVSQLIIGVIKSMGHLGK